MPVSTYQKQQKKGKAIADSALENLLLSMNEPVN